MRKTWVYDPHSGGVKIPQSVRDRTQSRILEYAKKHYAGKYTRIEVRFRGQLCYIDAYIQSPAFLLILTPQHMANLVRNILKGCEMSPFTYVAYVTLEMKIVGLWHFTLIVMKSMKLVFSTTAVSTVHQRKPLKLLQCTCKIKTVWSSNKVLDLTLRVRRFQHFVGLYNISNV